MASISLGLAVTSACVTNQGGGGAAWTPASLFAASEVGAWYDPSDLTTMWTDDGTTQAGVGDAVYRIDDKSGNGNHARQTTLAKRPILRQSGALYYLEFDGVDDFLSTAAIDFSANDEMSVFAGLTKGADDSIRMAYELSASLGANNGAFNSAPGYSGSGSTTGAFWHAASKGTGASVAVTTTDYPAPYTAVATHLSDISEDKNILRLNGVQVVSQTTDQGTGNFGNYPFYIGSRGGTTFYFSGEIYSLIVRGLTSTSEEITAAESYVAGKSGVTLA